MIKLLFLLFLCPLASAGETVVSRHLDRHTDKMVLFPHNADKRGKNNEATAIGYLRNHWQRFGLAPNAANLELVHTRKSLLGEHYTYRQLQDGVPLESAEIAVSLDEDGTVSRVFNATWPIKTYPKQPIQLDRDDALDVAWRHLVVTGELFAEPSAEKVWQPYQGSFRLVYRVRLMLTAPRGGWSLAVDAIDGRVLSVEEVSLSRHGVKAPPLDSSDLVAADRQVELAHFRERQQAKRSRKAGAKRAQGSAMVFDPDPRTSLMDPQLGDDNEPEDFEAAYVWRDLLGISQNQQGQFTLDGPWVTVVDFDVPFTPPTTTADGVWAFERGNNGFNDAMTYFHVDQSQRYIQSLGFIGETGIQYGAIEVDTDGAFGDDNSFYFYDCNCMSFGHGCVDDNEDADVILHEYGHALQASINPNWFSAGDEGAIGEGFGDYWGASYSFRTANGPLFHPEWIYSWDGHGPEFCSWEGRFMDKLDARYDPDETYVAHWIFDGFVADELWGTPLFQAMMTLYHQGIPIAEVDRCILEAHFGLTSGVRMPEIAASTVEAARRLYPNGPHAQVFQNAFARHNILPGKENYSYYSIHISPTVTEWENQVFIHNPNRTEALVTAVVYQDSGDEFRELSSTPLSLAAGESHTFVPGGAGSRWIRFNSNLPLTGTTATQRKSNEQIEKVILPLLAENELSNEIVIPHVPADRETFWSGAALLNPGPQTVSLSYQLIGSEGGDLSHTLNARAPRQLGPYQKWVNLLAGGLFDDSESTEKVSWLRVRGSGPLAGLQLYGFEGIDGKLGAAGVTARPDQQLAFWPVRVSLSGVDFNSFSVLNPGSTVALLSAQIIYKDGTQSQAASFSIGAGLKKMGRNSTAGFTFPVNDETALFEVENGGDIQAILFQSSDPLRIFEMSGSEDGSYLDGVAVTGVTSHVVFPEARGTLEIVRYGYAGEVSVSFLGSGTSKTRLMAVGASWSVPIYRRAGAIEIKGGLFQATLIERNLTYLTNINGKQIEFNP